MDRAPSAEWRREAIETVADRFTADRWRIESGPSAGPSAIATPTDDEGDRSPGRTREESDIGGGLPRSKPIAIEPLSPAEATPTTIVSRLVHAERMERNVLFVAADAEATSSLTETLETPTLLSERRDGLRTFYDGPDRIPVAAGGYALTRTPALVAQWRETNTPSGPLRTDEAGDRAPRLVLEIDGRVVAVAPDVDGLQVPPASTFPFRYFRDPQTKRFYVCRTRDGPDGPIEDFGGVTELRDAGYRPVPMPLVPEHLFSEGPPAWLVADPSGAIVLESADVESDIDVESEVR